MNAIPGWLTAQIRDQAARASSSGPVEYGGPPERISGTGRACCRQCGQRIAKGVPAVRFFWDFGGCGSFTATAAQIHENPADCRTK